MIHSCNHSYVSLNVYGFERLYNCIVMFFYVDIFIDMVMSFIAIKVKFTIFFNSYLLKFT